MENREIITAIREAGSLEDRKNIKEKFKQIDLNAIKQAEVKCLEHAKIVADMKQAGLSYQWHESKSDYYYVEMVRLTNAFLFKY